MSYTVLARKYRPQKFSEVIGQEHVTRTLQNAIEQGRTAHGYIFSGHRGIGKTTVARILAAALNCRSSDKPVAEPCGVCESCTEIRAGNAVDVIEIDAATNRGIDEIRELREAARYRPARDRFKIYILDEAHQITDAAFNALLKTLEEPPDHIVFMLATTQPEDIPQTIRSRCQHFSFRAVKFDDIVGQLRDLVGRENIEADDDALALLAEAGDGSMRDALSILDQAIASSSSKLTADSVRNLVGAAPAHVLEEVMKAVASGASEDVLRQVDHLISEGHSPALCSPVGSLPAQCDRRQDCGQGLFPAADIERRARARGARRELFGEEDLTRHLQIMLRTHGELGYKQEQRFHLELGLLKMAHAQRLLPIEQLLSDVASSNVTGAGTGAPRASARPSIVPAVSGGSAEARRTEAIAPARPNHVSPFAADSARKGSPRQESAPDQTIGNGPRSVTGGSQPARVVMGSAAPANLNENVADLKPNSQTEPQIQGALQVFSLQPASSSAVPIERLESAVVQALMDGNQRILVSMLEAGEWSVDGNEVVIKVSESQTVVDMSLGADARRLAIASASGILGRAVKLRIVAGAVVATAEGKGNGTAAKPGAANSGIGGRGRAEQDAVVRRLQEKFGAAIRTVIDYKEKR